MKTQQGAEKNKEKEEIKEIITETNFRERPTQKESF